MKHSEGIEAAIHVATMLAALPEGDVLPGKSLAQFHGLSPTYLSKTLKQLVAAGLFQAVSGPTGGYRLARAADQITLKDVVLAIEGTGPIFRCGEIRQGGKGAPGPEAYPVICNIHAAMLRAERAYRDALAEITIEALVGEFEKEGTGAAKEWACVFLTEAGRKQNTNSREGPQNDTAT